MCFSALENVDVRGNMCGHLCENLNLLDAVAYLKIADHTEHVDPATRILCYIFQCFLKIIH